MNRRLFPILSALSLLLFVAVVVLWVRSYFRADLLERIWHVKSGSHNFVVQSYCGLMEVDFADNVVANSDALEYFQTRIDRQGWEFMSRRSEEGIANFQPSAASWQRLGFAFSQGEGTAGLGRPDHTVAVRRTIVIFPYWLIAVIAAILPTSRLLRIRTWRGQRRMARGQCPRCGYDLRATPDQCPECGTVPKSSV